MMRVVGGRLKGRNLASPSSREIRPTADRLRESLFNILFHAYGDPIAGDPDIGSSAGLPRTIHHQAILDHDIEGHRPLS